MCTGVNPDDTIHTIFRKKETLSLPDEPMNLQKNEPCFSKSGAAPSYAILLND